MEREPLTSSATPAVALPPQTSAASWPWWQRVLFRFFFVYMLLTIASWQLFSGIPGVPFLLKYVDQGINWAVAMGNATVFHLKDQLVPIAGSGDTSFAFAQILLYLGIAVIVCLIWSVLDRKREEYSRLSYWFRLALRYYVASYALSYGIIKLFGMQMPFPNASILATPLGDLSPMRLTWQFIGYSFPYEFFSGLIEATAGMLLLYRRTITAGLLLATGAFMNVVMINFGYDVPVKQFSSHLLLACLFLLALDYRRLLNFLVLNRSTAPTEAYTPPLTRPWQIWASRGAKLYLVWHLVLAEAKADYTSYQQFHAPAAPLVFPSGMYDVRSYVVNTSSLPISNADSIRWKDVIIETNGIASVNSADSSFRRLYGRGYFRFRADTVKHTVDLWKRSQKGDTLVILAMRYERPDTNTIRLHTVIRGDSVHIELAHMTRPFLLAQRPFQWMHETVP